MRHIYIFCTCYITQQTRSLQIFDMLLLTRLLSVIYPAIKRLITQIRFYSMDLLDAEITDLQQFDFYFHVFIFPF